MTGALGEEFNETIIEAMDGTSRDVAERNEGALIFATFLNKTGFGEANCGYFGISIYTSDETARI